MSYCQSVLGPVPDEGGHVTNQPGSRTFLFGGEGGKGGFGIGLGRGEGGTGQGKEEERVNTEIGLALEAIAGIYVLWPEAFCRNLCSVAFLGGKR